MAKIKATGTSALFNHLEGESKKFGETNDCTVKALAAVANIPYETAHKALEARGRKRGQGMYFQRHLDVLNRFGFKAVKVDPQTFINQYPKSHQILKSVTTHHPERFNRVWKNGKTYLMITRGHVLAIRNGFNLDWTKGSARRCVALYEIVETGSGPVAPIVTPKPEPKPEPAAKEFTVLEFKWLPTSGAYIVTREESFTKTIVHASEIKSTRFNDRGQLVLVLK